MCVRALPNTPVARAPAHAPAHTPRRGRARALSHCRTRPRAHLRARPRAHPGGRASRAAAGRGFTSAPAVHRTRQRAAAAAFAHASGLLIRRFCGARLTVQAPPSLAPGTRRPMALTGSFTLATPYPPPGADRASAGRAHRPIPPPPARAHGRAAARVRAPAARHARASLARAAQAGASPAGAAANLRFAEWLLETLAAEPPPALKQRGRAPARAAEPRLRCKRCARIQRQPPRGRMRARPCLVPLACWQLAGAWPGGQPRVANGAGLCEFRTGASRACRPSNCVQEPSAKSNPGAG